MDYISSRGFTYDTASFYCFYIPGRVVFFFLCGGWVPDARRKNVSGYLYVGCVFNLYRFLILLYRWMCVYLLHKVMDDWNSNRYKFLRDRNLLYVKHLSPL